MHHTKVHVQAVFLMMITGTKHVENMHCFKTLILKSLLFYVIFNCTTIFGRKK